MADQTLSVLSSEPLTMKSPLNWRHVITWSSWPFNTCREKCGREGFKRRSMHVDVSNTGWVWDRSRVPSVLARPPSSSCCLYDVVWCMQISTDWPPPPGARTSCDETTNTLIHLQRGWQAVQIINKSFKQFLNSLVASLQSEFMGLVW